MLSHREQTALTILGLAMVFLPLLLWVSWTRDVYYIILILWGSCFWLIAAICHQPWRRWYWLRVVLAVAGMAAQRRTK
jgi:hypothetical protein